jgi:hypothetical protein
VAGGGVFALTVEGRAGRLGASPLSRRFGGSYAKSKPARSGGIGYRPYLGEFGHIDKSGEVFEVRTFVIEFTEVVMLRRVTPPQRFERVVVICPFENIPSDESIKKDGKEHTPVHRSQHACDKPVYAPTLLHEGNKCAYPAFVVDGLTEMGEYHPLE